MNGISILQDTTIRNHNISKLFMLALTWAICDGMGIVRGIPCLLLTRGGEVVQLVQALD